MVRFLLFVLFFFFFNDTATTEIYTLSLHDALPISSGLGPGDHTITAVYSGDSPYAASTSAPWDQQRSEEHTSELQSHLNLVCRLLLEKKKKKRETNVTSVSTTRRPN